MSAYVIKRLILVPPMLLGMATLVFILIRAVPGDYVDAILSQPGLGAATREDTAKIAQALRRELGLSDPLPVQYARWIGGLVRGDLGTSVSQQRPAWQVIRGRLGPTAEIALGALVLAYVWSLPLGIISAVCRNSGWDYTARIWSISGLSIPPFWLGILSLFVLVNYFQTAPPALYRAAFDDPLGNLEKIALPVLVLAYSAGAPIARLTRSQLLEIIGQDFIRTARAKGLGQITVIVRHAVRNAFTPILTLSASQVGRLLSGVVVVEAVFNIPGMGTGLLAAVNVRDYDLVGANLLVVGVLLVALNLCVDLLYCVIDPRIRYT